MFVQQSLIIVVLTSILMLSLSNGSTAATPIKKAPIKKLTKPTINKPPKVVKVQIVKKPTPNKPFQLQVLTSDDKAVLSIKVIYRGKTQIIKAKTKAKNKRFSITLIAPSKGKANIQVFAIDNSKLTSAATVVTIDVQPTPPPTEAPPVVFKPKTITTNLISLTVPASVVFEPKIITTSQISLTAPALVVFEPKIITTSQISLTAPKIQ